MNRIKGKYIGLNQRIPFEVLDSAIYYFLQKDNIDRGFIYQRMLEFTSGENRANKAAMYVFQILTRQKHLLEHLKKAITNIPYSSLRINDRKAICLCFISLTFPITYDLLIALSQGFKVQSQINKKFISEKVMSIYGSNRTVDIAIDALLPMIIELNTIKRDKVSIYSTGTALSISNNFVTELILYTDIKLAGSKSILIEELAYQPWYSFFDFSNVSIDDLNIIITRKESSIGKGYLMIK